ncbi:CsiV family protein [Alteromonas sp. H39]|uniref:CsiV family protein n=1 Tax=Alteromonas sp. H39 TaxID=3389876 RepID=UPI0039DFC84B
MFSFPRVGKGLLLAAFALSASPAQAEDDWWFDVEVIVFDRNVALTQLQETFEFAKDVSPYAADIDVIGNIIRPDISWIKQNLAKCDGSDAPLWRPAPSVDDIVRTYQQWQQTQENGGNTDSSGQINAERSAEYSAQRQPALSDAVTTLNTRPDAATPEGALLPSEAEIAGYWVEFSGINDVRQVSVPRFRYCEEIMPWLAYSDSGWKRYRPDNRLPAPEAIPIELSGHDWPRANQAHLLSANAQELEKLSEQIRRNRDLTRLLHVTWRQQVRFGQDTASSVRLYAGQNYAQRFTLDGYAIPPEMDTPAPLLEVQQEEALRTLTEDTFFADLNARLAAPQTVPLARLLQLQAGKDNVTGLEDTRPMADTDTPIWQLDGYMKVFLKYINRVPYLHIDSEMFYRQPVPVTAKLSSTAPDQPEYKLVSVPFKQLRRVISNQLHYFDHPLFGMVVEIRRYERPVQQESSTPQ